MERNVKGQAHREHKIAHVHFYYLNIFMRLSTVFLPRWSDLSTDFYKITFLIDYDQRSVFFFLKFYNVKL